MREVEITSISPLIEPEFTLVQMHSLLNVLNVLTSGLTLLGLDIADDERLLESEIALCEDIRHALTNKNATFEHLLRAQEHQVTIREGVAHVLILYPEAAQNEDVQQTLEALDAVLQVLSSRAQEMIDSLQYPDQWITFDTDSLVADFQTVFDAMEKNSRGRYSFVYNLAQQEDVDYFIEFKIDSTHSGMFSMPMRLKDVIRDLIANARKYTPLGGQILVGMFQDDKEIRVSIQDNGRGIPEGEIEDVVSYGRRGSNVEDVRTMGGGFGLTKAFVVVKEFGGRLWIKSGLDRGTRVKIQIPMPRLA